MRVRLVDTRTLPPPSPGEFTGIQISPVWYSADGRFAALYRDTHCWGGDGEAVLLERKRGRWRVVLKRMTWISYHRAAGLRAAQAAAARSCGMGGPRDSGYSAGVAGSMRLVVAIEYKLVALTILAHQGVLTRAPPRLAAFSSWPPSRFARTDDALLVDPPFVDPRSLFD